MNWGEFTTATAPWWFVALLAGMLSIVSTLLGAAVSVWSTAASDRRRSRSELAKENRAAHQAWCQSIRHLSAAFIVSSRQFAKTVQGQYAREEDGTGQVFWRRGPGPRADLHEAFVAYWELVLAADPETSRLAQALIRQVRRYDAVGVADLELISNSEWTSMRAAVVSARGALAEHVIRETSYVDPPAVLDKA